MSMDRLYEKFTEGVFYVVIHAKAASIGAKVDCLYPESLAVGLLTTGANRASEILVDLDIDLEKCLAGCKKLLSSRRQQNSGPLVNLNLNDLQISKETIEVLQAADKIRESMRFEYIDVEHVFVALINKSRKIQTVFAREGLSLDEFVKRIRRSRRSTDDAPRRKKEKKRKSNVSALDEFCSNFTAMARNNEFDPIIARDKEINLCITTLCRRIKNNPILLGHPGVGKTAIVEGIAQRIVSSTVPKQLAECEVYALSLSSLVAGTKYRGDFEDRMERLVTEIQSRSDCILFIDEVHTLIGAGSSSSGALDASNILKPFLARNDLRCIGATTFEDYKKYFEKDGALTRRFQQVSVDEPTIEQMFQILFGIKSRFEDYHSCVITDTAIDAAIKLSDRYLSARNFPDKAIDCIDCACAERNCREEREVSEGKVKDVISVSYEDVASVVSQQCSVPIEVMMWDNNERVKSVGETLSKRVFGQTHVIDIVCRVLKNAYSGLRNPLRPIGSLVFGGQSGTGKTHMAKEMARAIFGDDASFIKLDMSEFSEPHSVSKLIGSPPGYVGFHEVDVFVDKIRRKPYSIVLFDEMEKAHPEVMRLFLQVMSDGVMTDAIGNKVDFKNVILIMTGNFGMNEGGKSALGFGDASNMPNYKVEQNRLIESCKEKYGAEFVNRVDEFVAFLPLGDEDMLNIIRMKLEEISERVTGRGCEVKFTDKTVSRLLELSRNEHGMNASILDRLISKQVDPCVADALLELEGQDGTITITVSNDAEFVARKRKTRKSSK